MLSYSLGFKQGAFGLNSSVGCSSLVNNKIKIYSIHILVRFLHEKAKIIFLCSIIIGPLISLELLTSSVNDYIHAGFYFQILFP